MYLLQDLARGLRELLNYEGNVEEDFYLTFQVGRTFIVQSWSRMRNSFNKWKMGEFFLQWWDALPLLFPFKFTLLFYLLSPTSLLSFLLTLLLHSPFTLPVSALHSFLSSLLSLLSTSPLLCCLNATLQNDDIAVKNCATPAWVITGFLWNTFLHSNTERYLPWPCGTLRKKNYKPYVSHWCYFYEICWVLKCCM